MSTPTLTIVIGTAGSGKSTVARRLARRLGAAYRDKDAMSARFVEAALLAAGHDAGDRESSPFYREQLLPLEYDSLLDVAGANLRVGCSVVLDAPFSPYLSQPSFITSAAERFAWPPVDVEVVRVRVAPETLRERLHRRALARDRVKLAHWDEFWSVHGSLRCEWLGVRLTEMSNDALDPELAAAAAASAAMGGDAREGEASR